MSLSDIMSHSGLTGYAEVGLVISLAAFTVLVFWVFLRPREEMEKLGRRALEDDDPGARPDRASDATEHSRSRNP
jgi:hypothetical protein